MTKKLTKRFVSFIVTLAMVMTVMPIIPAMAANGRCETLAEVVQALGGDTKAKADEANNKVTLIDNVTNIGDTRIDVSDMTLDLADKSITLNNDCTLIFVSSATITGDTGFITQAAGNGTYWTIQAANPDKDITVKLTGGTIKNADNSQRCVYVGNGDRFEMSGGKIESPTRSIWLQDGSSAAISGNAQITSTSTNIEEPAVVVMGGSSLDMSGGTITSNGVCMQVEGENSKINVTNGTIQGNASDQISAVYVISQSSFEMTGGKITTAGGQAVSVGQTAEDTNTTATIGGTAEISRTGDQGVGLLEVKGQQCKLNIEDKAHIKDTIMVFANGELNISGGTIESEGYAVGTNGSGDDSDNSSKGAKINITGGKITSDDDSCAIYAPAGTWKITNGEITGGAGIVVRGADVDVTGGTITATAASTANIDVGDAGHTVPAAGISVDVADYPSQTDGQKHVTISDGATVKATAEGGKTLAACENGSAVSPDGETNKVDDTKNPFDISGGTFQAGTSNNYDTETVDQFLPKDTSYTDTGEVEYTGTPVVTRNNVPFGSLEDALKGAQDGDKIQIVANDGITLPGLGSGDDRIKIDKKITIDINGKTINKDTNLAENKGGLLVVDGGDLTIIDSTGAETTGSITGKGTLLLVKGTGKLTIDQNAKIVQTGGTETENDTAVSVDESGVLTIAGGTITAEETGVGVFGNGQLTITGGTIDAVEMGVSTNGKTTDDGAKIEITGGNITSSGSAGVYLPKGGMTVKDDAKITGKAGIVQFGGTLTVEGGTIKATDTENDNITVGDSGQEVPVAAVTTNKQSGYADPTATLKGGKFEGSAADKPAVSYTEGGSTAAGDSALTVEGGSYSAPVDSNLLSETLTYEAKSTDAETPYSYHKTEGEAQAAAGDDGTVSKIVATSEFDQTAVALYGDSKITSVTTRQDDEGNDVVDITVSVGEVGAQEAGGAGGDAHKGDAAFWVGIGLVKPADATGVEYTRPGLVGYPETFTPNNGDGSFDNFAGKQGFGAWVNVGGATGGKNALATYIMNWKKADGAKKVTYNITFKDITLKPDDVTPFIDAVGFKATKADADAAIIKDFGSTPIADDVADNTMYAVFHLQGTPSSTNVTVTFSDGTTTYTEPAFVVEDNDKHIVYFSFDYLGTNVTGGDKLGEGHYTITVKASDKFQTVEELDVYKVVYKAENGTVTQPTKAIYAASVADADTLTATKPEVTPDSGYTAENVDWSEGKPSDTDHTITYTATCAKEYVPVVEAATIADSNGDVANVVGDYSAEYTEKDAATDHYKITGTAADLKKHTNGDGTEGYWFGVEIKAPDGVDTETADKEYKVTFDKETTAHPSKFDDLVNIAGAKGAILYFDTKGDGNDKHTVTIEWDDSTKFIYDIDLTEVKHYVENPKYTVTCETATGGKVEADKTDAAEDETVTLTVTAETGYKLDTLVVKDAANTEVATAQQADGTYTFTMPASNVTVTATFAAETVEPDTAEIKFVGFVTKDENGNNILNALAPQVKGDGATWGTDGITDCIANTLYAAFSADNEEGVTYTVKFTKGEKSYEQTVEGVTKGGLAYVSFDDQAKNAFGAEPQGEYTVELFKDGTLVNASSDKIKVYQIKYVAGEGVTGNNTVVYTDAEGLDAAKTVRPEGFALASGMNRWNDNKAETSGYTVTVTLSGYHRSTSSGGSGGSSNHSVSAPSKSDNGSVSVSSKSAPKGSKVTITVKPDKGYKTGSVTVKDANGNILEVTDNGDGTYSFVMPDTKVSVATEFVEEGTATPAPDTTPSPETTPAPDAEDNCPSEKFVDVDQSQWYHEGIDYALTNGLMSGMDDTTFEPDSTTTRAMIVAVLYRLDGSPEVAMANFTDVPENAWYANAVAWGEANGVVSGYDAETFGPEDSITREQMASILYRYAQYKGIDVSAQADLSVYSDAGSVSDWANTSLSWANAEGLVSGMSDTELAPTGTATRAQVAAILMRYCENIAK